MDDISLEEERRKHALELACENFGRIDMACNTESLLKQAKEFEDYLKGSGGGPMVMMDRILANELASKNMGLVVYHPESDTYTRKRESSGDDA
jgi:hypothetical protein